jgi:hypothetical protein
VSAAAQVPPKFSLVVGGLFFQTLRRVHLSGDALEFLRRRVVAITLFTWLPLLMLSAIDGNLRDGAIKIPFLYDVAVHVRFLIALPLLMVAEVFVHERISPVIDWFVDRRIVSTKDLPVFSDAVRFTTRACNSIVLEWVLLGLVYTLGIWLWRDELAVKAATWYARPAAGSIHLTLAGSWYAVISIPFFQFILLRWYVRMVLWFQLLWRISRLKLNLAAAHPDRAGGIGFLGDSAYAFSPILFAQGVLLSGLIANRVLREGQSVMAFKMEAAGLVCVLVLFVLGPLVMFTRQLDRAKREGAAEWGLLAARSLFTSQEKWPEGDGYAVASRMRLVPFGGDDVLRLVAVTIVPLLPLALTMFSLQDLLTRLLKIVF